MNFVGHIQLAYHGLSQHAFPPAVMAGDGQDSASAASGTDEQGSVERYLFGTALPDFATIGRFQLRYGPTDPNMAQGVAVHHTTDAAFHASDWFAEHSRSLSQNLKSRGVNRGAARACGHVGVELLLDGHLLDDDATLAERAQAILAMADQSSLDLDSMVDGAERQRWRSHLDQLSTWTVPADYHQVEAVAQRLYRILRPRRRLAFEPSQIAEVADALDEADAALRPGIGAMVEQVTGEIIGSTQASIDH